MPTGVVTFLFTDIEGSTKLLQRLGDRFAGVLADHHEIMRAAITAHGGYEVRTDGDGFFVAFRDPSAAVRTAADAQRALATHPWPHGERVRVRMGIHSGEVRASGDDYVGISIHHATRIMAAANGGQVLVSEVARALVHLDDVRFTDLGTFELKDLGRAIVLHQLVAGGLETEFPSIRALSDRRHNLPMLRTTFVGRDDEVRGVLAGLDAPGCLTLTGPGGCGKTRLALEVAHRALDTFDGGCWFVDLRAITDGAQVLGTVAMTLGVTESDSDERWARTLARLASAPALLILDNCEHLVDAVADVVERLLAATPDLRVIATSRDLLGIPDEIARRVRSLPVPEDGAAVDEALGSAAVELFVERAQRVAPSFAVDDATVAAVVRICRRLDGIPLAIELAAARMRHMSAEALERKLDDMFRVLVGSDRRALQRHQTLSAVVDWSYDLLTHEERTVLRRLSVFVGSFSADAAEQVCADETLKADQVADVLFRLVDRSLVEREADGDRYRLLETILQYAQAKVHTAGESEAVRDRHLETFLVMGERLGPTLEGEMTLELLRWAQPDADNLLAAIEWAVRSSRIAEGLRFTASTPCFFACLGRSDVLRLYDEAIDAAGGGDTELLARAHVGLAIAETMFEGELMRRSGSRAQEMFERLGADDDQWYGWAAAYAPAPEGGMGDASIALVQLDRAEQIVSREGWTAMLCNVWAWRGWALMRSGDLIAGRLAAARALELARRGGNDLVVGARLFQSGLMSMNAQDYPAARAFYEEGLPIYRRLVFKQWLQWELDHLAGAALALDDLTAARAYAEEAVTVSRESGLIGPDTNYPSLLATLGTIEHRLGDLEQARWYHEQAVEMRRTGLPHAYVHALAALGLVEVDADAVEPAARHLREALDILPTLEPVEIESGSIQQPPVASVLLPVAWLAAHRTDSDLAATLAGAALSWMERGASPFVDASRVRYERRIEPVRAATGARFDELFAAGGALEDAEAIARATDYVREIVAT